MNENNNVTENTMQETSSINTVTNTNQKGNRGLIVLVIVLLLIVIGLIAFIICDKFVINNTDANDDKKTVETDDKDKGEKTETSKDNNISESRELKEEELKEFVTYFNKKEINGFVTQNYNSKENIKIDQVVYNGLGNNNSITDQEAIDYSNATNLGMNISKVSDLPTNIVKLTKQEVTDHMKKYAGVDNLNNFKWTYLNKYDAYYYMHGDTNYMEVSTCSSGKIDDNGNYITTCTFKSEGPATIETTMKKQDNVYMFVSNKCIKNCELRFN